MKNRILHLSAGVAFFTALLSPLGAQDISFQFGSIPFGSSETSVVSTFQTSALTRKEVPEAQFLAVDVLLQENLQNKTYLFFDEGIKKTVSWGDAYVMLDERFVKRVDVRPSGEPKADLFFYGPGNGDKKLFMVHKTSRIEGEYTEIFENLIPSISSRIGSEPVSADKTRFRGFSYELYGKYAFWEGSEVTVFTLVREKTFQSKVSVVEYVYIDTRLWNAYKAVIKNGAEKDLLQNF